MATYTSRVICQRHNFTATVGAAVAFALDYYECPACVAIQDADYEARRRPCCSRYNIDCCGHNYDEPQPEDTSTPDEKLLAELMAPARNGYVHIRGIRIESPNWCEFPPPPF